MKNWEKLQGIYVHIPFCLQKCAYCDFASAPRQGREVMAAYTAKLCQEILTRELPLPVQKGATIYLGGGTPSLLPLELLTTIVNALKERGLWQQPAEATLEANPGTLTREKLAAYRALGFDRLSMGIQSLQDWELKAMGRTHTAREALATIQFAQAAGFTRINGDLLYGYPGQTLAAVQNSAQQLLNAGLTHVSLYGLTVEKGTVLAKQLEKKLVQLPSDDETGDMYDYLTEFLPAQGLQRYEISNFAVPGQESLHNRIYWHYLPYLGLGAAACGFDGRRRVTNPSLKGYLGGEPADIEVLPAAIRLSECIFMGLRTREGVSNNNIKERFGVKITEKYGAVLAECLRDGLLDYKQEQDSYSLTVQGMRYGNQVFEKFL